ncbi:MAG: vWA domain-containing protein [Acidimicrobiales bacterium]
MPDRPASDRPAPGAIGSDGAVSAERVAVGFVEALRRAGLRVALGSAITYLQALGQLDVSRATALYWAGRATLIRRPEDVGTYDKVFAAYFAGERGESLTIPVPDLEIILAFDDPDGEEPPPPQSEDVPERDSLLLQVRYSGVETLRHKDFAQCSTAELDEARRLMSELRLVGSPRRSRRWKAAKGSDVTRLDLRRTVRGALRASGEPMVRKYLTHGHRPRRLVLLLDVSGSMEPYARAFLRFVHAAVVGRTKVEAFAMGTRLTRMTRELQNHDPDAALRRAASAVMDYSGGTRLGEALQIFNDRWGIRGMARGAIVVILSDGWDRGEPELLGREMARLHRVAYRVVWVNPLKASPGYAPLAQGMAAALPHVDRFIEGHSLASLEELATVIAA